MQDDNNPYQTPTAQPAPATRESATPLAGRGERLAGTQVIEAPKS